MRLVLVVMKFCQRRKKTGSRFYFQSTKTQRINSILKVMTKFMVSKMTQAYTQSCEQLYPIYVANTKYTIQNLSFKFDKDFLNILYDSELRVSKLNLFHSLIVKGKKKLAKYLDLQKICLILLLFGVRQVRSPDKIYLQRQPGDLFLTIL